jgi:hypothetical protein
VTNCIRRCSWSGIAIADMPEDELSDDFVANLLKEEAKAKSDKYSSIGFEAFLPTK